MGGGGGGQFGFQPKNGSGSGDGLTCNPIAEDAACANTKYQPLPTPDAPFAHPFFPRSGTRPYPSCVGAP
jgi:hypothetical protein